LRGDDLIRELVEEILLDERRRRRRPRHVPWSNLDDMQAHSRLAAVKRRRGRLIRNQLLSFRWADDPPAALRDLKMRAKGGR
jgi:hypothetical protein